MIGGFAARCACAGHVQCLCCCAAPSPSLLSAVSQLAPSPTPAGALLVALRKSCAASCLPLERQFRTHHHVRPQQQAERSPRPYTCKVLCILLAGTKRLLSSVKLSGLRACRPGFALHSMLYPVLLSWGQHLRRLLLPLACCQALPGPPCRAPPAAAAHRSPPPCARARSCRQTRTPWAHAEAARRLLR